MPKRTIDEVLSDEEELFTHLQEEMGEQFDDHFYENRKDHLQRVMSLIQFAIRERDEKDEKATAPARAEKPKKINKSQGTTLSQMLYFAKHLFVAPPGANAEDVRKYWKEDGPFPAKQIGDWFSQYRSKYRQNLEATFDDVFKDVRTFDGRTGQQDRAQAKAYMEDFVNVAYLFSGILPYNTVNRIEADEKKALARRAIQIMETLANAHREGQSANDIKALYRQIGTEPNLEMTHQQVFDWSKSE